MKKFLNPFIYLSGERCAAYGAILMIFSAILAWQTDLLLAAPLSISFGEMALWRTTLRFLISWGVFALLLYLWALLLSKSKIRAVDLFGMNLLARSLPLFVLLLLSLWMAPLMRPLIPQMVQGGMPMDQLMAVVMRPRMMIAGLLSCAGLVWYFVWCWKAFTLAANLKGVWSVVGFILAYLLSEWLVGVIFGYL